MTMPFRSLRIYLRLSGDGCSPANASTWALQLNAKHDRSRPVIDGAAAGGGWFIVLLPEDKFIDLLPLVAGGGCGCTNNELMYAACGSHWGQHQRSKHTKGNTHE